MNFFARSRALATAACLLALPLALGACRADADANSQNAAALPSLYERLGREPAIVIVVDDFVRRAAANPRVNFARVGTSREWPATPEAVAYLKRMLVEFIAHHTGGPMLYTGKSMVEVHTGMGITDAEFDALAADLDAALIDANVAKRERAELLAIVGTTRKDILGR